MRVCHSYPVVRKLVLDSSAILEGFAVPGDSEVYVPPGVAEEVKSKSYDFSLVKIVTPSRYNTKLVVKAAKETGDFPSLSNVDVEVLALALQVDGEIVSDDYAIQNVASHLGLKFHPLHQDGIREVRRWKWRCTSCGRYYGKHYPVCPVCGGELKRVRKSGKGVK